MRKTSLQRFGVSPKLVRLSLGLEDGEDLWDDFLTAVGDQQDRLMSSEQSTTTTEDLMKQLLTGVSVAAMLLTGTAQAETTLQLVEVITSPQRTEVLEGHDRQVRGSQP